jgi:phage shock protein E
MLTKNFIFLSLLTLTMLLIASCGLTNTPTESQSATGDIFSLPKNAEGYIDISVDQLKLTLANKDFSLINVHIPYEGELPQTDSFIPYNEIEANLGQLPADKNARIVLYCRSGRMSTEAAQTLVNLGYTKVAEVDGGMHAWQAAGNELSSK